MWSNANKYQTRTALVNGLNGDSIKYSEASEMSTKVCHGLKQMGAKKGDVLAMFLPNCMEYPVVFGAATNAGMAATTMNPIYTSTEIARQLKMSKASWAVTNRDLVPVIKDAITKLGQNPAGEEWKNRIIIVDKEPVPGCINLELVLEAGKNIENYTKTEIDVMNDLACLPYSSGTTGLPKGVMLTHFNLVANACQSVMGHPDIQICGENEVEQPVTLCILPLYHIYALNVTMTPTLWSGGQLVMLPKFDPKTFIHALETYKPTFLHLAPPLLAFCADNAGVKAESLERLHHIMTAAAPSGPTLLRRFKKKAPSVILKEGWGMSETSPLGLLSSLSQIVEGSCGVVTPNTECKIVDVSTGDNLPPHKTGELCIRGPQVMPGYLDNDKATKETIKENGWLYSGDIAYHDEDGNIFIVDRLKELIKVKGFQVPPAELEDLLRTIPGVADVAVIGIPHERFGEAPRAYIVKSADSKITDVEITKYVAENAAPYKQLVGGVEFIEAIPKSNPGKILRKELKASFK